MSGPMYPLRDEEGTGCHWEKAKFAKEKKKIDAIEIRVRFYAENERFCLPVCAFFFFSPLGFEALALGMEGLPQETCCIEGFDRT